MSISNEELLIRALVDDIYKTEEKINLLNESINKDKSKDSSFKKIEYLKSIKNNLIQQKFSLNESILEELKNNNNIIKEKINKIKEIENNLELKKNELINFNVLFFKCLPLKKYILANKSNDFLTEDQINDIIFDGQFPSSNFEIKNLKKELEVNKASESVIINNINNINGKIEQIKENLKMLKEEKNTVKMLLINLISCKETLEQIIKLNINSLNIHNKMINNKNDKNKKQSTNNINNKWSNPINLYIYELNIIDPKKAAKNICNELFNLFNLTNDGSKKDIIFNKNLSIDKKKNKNIYSFFTSDEFINNNIGHNNNKSFVDIPKYQLDINNNKNISLLKNINYSNIILNYFSLNKNELYELIQNEIEKFITGKIYSYKTMTEFLGNLSIIIISKFQNIDIIISSDILTIYLSYFFKSLYYESIINSNIKFINKDYKTRKKEYKNLVQILQNESSKLDSKFNEYKSKSKIIEKQIKFIEKEIYNKKKNEPIILTLEEQNYIQICSKANALIKQKKNFEIIINQYEEKNNKYKIENELKIKKIDIEINKINKQIIKLNNELKNKENKANKNIDYYQKIIQEKYNVIKKQLLIYKNKYGSNLDIYNRLINSINDTIKKTYGKQPLIIINNNNNINNSHIFNNEIGKIFNNYNKKSKNKTIKDFLFTHNNNIDDINNYKNSGKKITINSNTNNSNNDIINIEFDNSSIDKSLYEINNKFGEKRYSLINNTNIKREIENKQQQHQNKKEKTLIKINDKIKLNKALSNLNNLSYILHTNKKKSSINFENKRNGIKTKNNSLNYKSKDTKFKSLHYKDFSANISSREGKKNKKIKNKFNKGKFIINDISDTNNIKIGENSIKVNKNDKYNKSFSNYNNNSNSNNNNNSKLNTTNDKSIIVNNNKYQSFSFAHRKNTDYLFKKRNSSNILTNSSKKKNFIIYKTSSNSVYTIPNKINNYKNIIKKKYNISESLNEKGNDLFKIPNIRINLKDIINKDEIIFKKKIMEKINPLTKVIYCYYREYNNTLFKYNPLFDISPEFLCKLPYNFTNATISLTKKYDKIIICTFGNTNKYIINIFDIVNTMVNSKIKLIVEVHRNYRKYKESTNLNSIEEFINNQKIQYPQLTPEEIEKCAKNKNFNFSLIINGGKIIELIICSYHDFKIWINGLAFLIKNKNDIMPTIKEYENNNTTF